MAFRFSQNALLRLRATLQQVEERALLRMWQEARSGEKDLERAQAVRRDYRQRRTAPPPGAPLLGADLQFSDFVDAHLAGDEERMRQRLAAKQREVQTQLAVFREARRRREVIEALRDRELRTHREGELRREQRALDDAYLMQLLLPGRQTRG